MTADRTHQSQAYVTPCDVINWIKQFSYICWESVTVTSSSLINLVCLISYVIKSSIKI
jgi:hypothetical protein